MAHTLTKDADVFKLSKQGINLQVYQDLGDCGVVVVETAEGHNQEFLNKRSTYNCIILDGAGVFFLNDEEVSVQKGDLLSVEPNTRIYYKGAMRFLLVTTPAWREEDEVETKTKIW